jgi:hypothetical protein
MEINKLSSKARLILALVYLSGGSIRGETRLQKLALLVSKDIQKSNLNLESFHDWVPDNYGGRSTQVYLTRNELLDSGAIKEENAKIDHNKTMKIYSLTSFGNELSKDVSSAFESNWKGLEEIAGKYIPGSTNELIGLSYRRYRELTINSKIIQEVNRQLLKKVSPLSPMYEEDVGLMPSPSSDRRKDRIREAANDEKFFKQREFEMQRLPDIEARKKLAALVGLKELPKLDPMAIYRLDGILSRDLGKDKKFDSVELVRSVRGD